MSKAVGTVALCTMCGREFVRRRARALNCSRKCSQNYSNYRAGRAAGAPEALAADADMDRAWHFALSEMPAPCAS